MIYEYIKGLIVNCAVESANTEQVNNEKKTLFEL